MKFIIAMLLLVLIAVNLFLCWQVIGLRQDTTALRSQLAGRTANSPTLDLFGTVLPGLDRVRDAIAHADYPRAQRLLRETSEKANSLSRTMGEKSGPSMDWIRRQIDGLQAQITPTPEQNRAGKSHREQIPVGK